MQQVMTTPTVSLQRVGNLEDVPEQHKNDVPMEYIIKKVTDIWANPDESNLLIVKAKTGSGKSVYMTKELMLHFNTRVYVSEPTVVSCIQAPDNISKLYGLQLG
jgi:HrpA-like RNA helicase